VSLQVCTADLLACVEALSGQTYDPGDPLKSPFVCARGMLAYTILARVDTTGQYTQQEALRRSAWHRLTVFELAVSTLRQRGDLETIPYLNCFTVAHGVLYRRDPLGVEPDSPSGWASSGVLTICATRYRQHSGHVPSCPGGELDRWLRVLSGEDALLA